MCRDMLNPGNKHGTSKILSHLKGSLCATDCEGYKYKIQGIEVQDVEFILHCKMKWSWFISVSRTFVVFFSGHA